MDIPYRTLTKVSRPTSLSQTNPNRSICVTGRLVLPANKEPHAKNPKNTQTDVDLPLYMFRIAETTAGTRHFQEQNPYYRIDESSHTTRLVWFASFLVCCLSSGVRPSSSTVWTSLSANDLSRRLTHSRKAVCNELPRRDCWLVFLINAGSWWKTYRLMRLDTRYIAVCMHGEIRPRPRPRRVPTGYTYEGFLQKAVAHVGVGICRAIGTASVRHVGDA
jgi:hypothetical protein